MPVDVSEDEYFAALSYLLDTADPLASCKTHRMSEETKARLIFWAYECFGLANESPPYDALPALDARVVRIALTVIAGRCLHGRPSRHPRYDELLAFCDVRNACRVGRFGERVDPQWVGEIVDRWLELRFDRQNARSSDALQ